MTKKLIKFANNRLNMAGPRSKLMDAILVLLLAMPLRTSEIAANLGLETKYVSSYLSYWRKKGLVELKYGRWHLTKQGEEYAKRIVDMRRDKKFMEHLAIAREILQQDFFRMNKNIDPPANSSFLEKLDDDEKELLLFLLNKYRQWGSTYVYLDQIQEELGADLNWLLRVLRKLQTKRIVYLYHDPKLGFRIGFTQKVKDIIADEGILNVKPEVDENEQ